MQLSVGNLLTIVNAQGQKHWPASLDVNGASISHLNFLFMFHPTHSVGIKIKLLEYCNEQYNIDRNSNLQIILEKSLNKIFSTVLFDIEETRPNFVLFDLFGPIEHLKSHDRNPSLQNYSHCTYLKKFPHRFIRY